MNPELERILAAKTARRERLRNLSFPDKVQAVIELQKMVAPILRTRNIQVEIWPDEPLANKDNLI